MKTDNLQRFLNSFGKNVIKQSRKRLTKGTKKYGSKNVTNALYNSLRFEVEEDGENFTVKFFMLGYGAFVDKGISGNKTIQEYTSWTGKKLNSPFSYTNKMPPPSKLDKWIVKRRLAPRDESGRFKGRSIKTVGFAKSISFLIARKIQLHGIKSLSFFQKPLGFALETFGKDLLESVGKDLTATIDGVTKDFPTQNN